MLIPLRLKYRQPQPKGYKSKTSNNTMKTRGPKKSAKIQGLGHRRRIGLGAWDG